MSFYLRSIPNKFTSFVNIRSRQVTDINYQLPKNVKSSLFLEEFLGIQTSPSTIINKKETSLNSLVPSSSQNVPVTFVSVNIGNPKVLNKKYNWNKQWTIKLHQQRQAYIQNITHDVNLDLTSTTLLRNNAQVRKQCEKSFIKLKNKKSNLSEMTPVKEAFYNVLFKSVKNEILYTKVYPNMQNKSEMQAPEDNKSFQTQLQNIFDVLREDLPLLFTQPLNSKIYTEDLIFVNNIKGTTTVGIQQYFKQISLLRLVGHVKFAYVKLEIIKMTMHPEDSSIKVRWRIVGISGTRVIFTFWRYKAWNTKSQLDSAPTWYDGFSTFYVNNDGKIFKHIVDKTMPDQDEGKIKAPIETKLALFINLLDVDSNF